ncbi:UbiA family prenyltransferase [Nitratireductor sp. XY-223]|uniref:UbiA family prenyltransferase n=1 Tax=Nitratireductor sp. XY-223 TaxID=2561926 RepID=UPI001FEFB74E|nr:UbiA family prenyltransferase [Nitratireductor sp. XY-223]
MDDNKARSEQRDVPLCVDLDGTLLKTDTLWESLVALIMRNPLLVFAAALWVLRGKAALKNEVAARTDRDPASWPYRAEIVDLLTREKQNGRRIVLATGAPKKVADGVAKQLGLFDVVLHTTPDTNLTASRKKRALVERFGEAGFDYIGDSGDDIAVFESARKAIVVAPDRAAHRWATAHGAEIAVEREVNARLLLKAMRVHQWLKNALLAVPLVLHHELLNISLLASVIVAFFSFSFAASFVYILNDLADLENDRLHHRKKERPLASGRLAIPSGMGLACVLLAASLALALLLPLVYMGVLLIYIAATTAYSFVLKRKLLVDVFTLAGLFTLRIIAGAAAIASDLSFWLLAFSIFFFLSLALVKRYVELSEITSEEGSKKLGRGYYAVDFEMIGQAGISSAFGAALVLALYVNSDEVQQMYAMPLLLWPLCPMIVYMLLRIWMLARRGQMHDDPVVFIISDWRSQLVAAVGAILVLAAAVNPL